MPSGNVDRVDRAIVTRLQADGRIANVDLADAVSLSPSACLRRVKALESSGLISGYRAEVDRARAGLGLTAFVGLRVQGHSRETSRQVEQALAAIPAVVACYVISGSDDFMVEVATSDLAGYERLLLDRILAIPSVIEAHSTFAIRTVREPRPGPARPLALTSWPGARPEPSCHDDGMADDPAAPPRRRRPAPSPDPVPGRPGSAAGRPAHVPGRDRPAEPPSPPPPTQFEERHSPEARFAKAMDRLQPLLLNWMARGGTWRSPGITADDMRARKALIGDASTELGAAARQLIDEGERRGGPGPAPGCAGAGPAR